MARGKGSVKVKKISVVSKDDTESLNKMFEQMTGIANAEPDVIIPKLLKIQQNIVKYYKLFSILVNFTEFKNLLDEYDTWFKDIETYIKNLKETNNIDLDKNYSPDIVANVHQLQSISVDELNKLYKDTKENPHVKEIVVTCSNLSNFKRYIENKDDINGKFINREPGLTLIPFSFSELDLKILWSMDDLSEQGRKFILSILHHSYTIGYEVYDIISSPDIDISKFSHILVESITKLRKQIPRCDKAFDVIENSVKLLEGNFKNYYKNSVEAENPNILVESFIIDVSTSQTASPLVTSQFRKIVSFLKQRSSGVTDPKVKALFGMLNEKFTAMDSEMGVKTSPIPDEPSRDEPSRDEPSRDEPSRDEPSETDEKKINSIR